MTDPHATNDPLTRRERDVLRGVLDHKTAKEMAIEFGVSHHAIEKRLKRARQKMGADSSLDAARLYRDRYGRTVSGPSDLEDRSEFHDDIGSSSTNGGSFRRRFLTMTILVSLAAVAIGVFAFMPSEGMIADGQPLSESMTDEHSRFSTTIALTIPEGADLYETAFAKTDRDGSGGIVIDEFVTMRISPNHPVFDGREAEARKIFRFMDSDENGEVVFAEFAAVSFRDDAGDEYEFDIRAN